MTRRGANTLLIIAYLASQLAALPHAHGESYEAQQPDHDARPHFHLGWFDNRERGDGRGDDHHESGTQSHDARNGCAIRTDDRHHGHDSDAVYLPSEAGSISLTGKRVVTDDSHQFVSLSAVASVPVQVVLFDHSASDFFPDKCNSGTPLYLTLRTLRL